jgi:hypothetical protein
MDYCLRQLHQLRATVTFVSTAAATAIIAHKALVSLSKAMLTDFVASLAQARIRALDQALRVALALG